jgi:pantothenate kinase-related protein Tda10
MARAAKLNHAERQERKGHMELMITICGKQGAGKTRMARFIAAICELERLSYRIIDSDDYEIVEGPMAVAKDEDAKVEVITRQILTSRKFPGAK